MHTAELFCGNAAEHGMHTWRPDGRASAFCLGWWPVPRDNEDWPLQRRPRWVRKDVFYRPVPGGCRYCGAGQGDHPAALCPLCGSVQCHRGESCLICHRGFLPGYRPGEMGICGYTGCGRPAIARVPGRVRRVCKGCVPRVPVRGRPIKLDELVLEFIAVRDSGKAPLKWRLVA